MTSYAVPSSGMGCWGGDEGSAIIREQGSICYGQRRAWRVLHGSLKLAAQGLQRRVLFQGEVAGRAGMGTSCRASMFQARARTWSASGVRQRQCGVEEQCVYEVHMHVHAAHGGPVCGSSPSQWCWHVRAHV